MTAFIGAAIYLVAIVASLCAFAAAASRWTRADALDRALVACVAVMSLSTGVALVLGMANLLSAGFYLGVVGAVGLGSGAYLVRAQDGRKRVPAAWSIAGLMTLLVGAGLAVLAAIPMLRGLGADDVDTRYYHISNLVHWFRTHSIWDLPFQNAGFFTNTHPGNGEIAGIATLFATGGDHLVYATNIFFGLVAVVAVALIARSLDGRPDLAALAAVAVMGTPLVFGTQAHNLATDLAATGALAAGVAASLRARQERDWRWIVTAGFALGFALGAKYTVLLLVPLVVLVALVVLKPRRDALWMTPGLVALGAPWFIRNWVSTGNPLFPQEISLLGLEIFPGAQSPLLRLKTTMLDHVIAGRGRPVRQFFDLSWDLWGPAILLAILGVAGIALRGRRKRSATLNAGLVAGLVVAAGLVYFVTPFTGAGVEGLRFLMGSNLRYTMTFAVLGAALAVAVLPNRVVNVVIAGALAFNAWWMIRGYGFRTDLDLQPLLTAAAVIAATAVAAAVTMYGTRKLNLTAPVLGGLAVASCLVLMAGVWRIDTNTQTTSLERALAAHRSDAIAVLGVNELRSVFGRTLRNTVEGVAGGGRAGERPSGSGELTAAIAASDSDVLVVKDGTPAVPQGWVPPSDEWTKTATTESGDVYVRNPEAPPAPTPSAPPAPSPSTPPAAPPATAPPVPAP